MISYFIQPNGEPYDSRWKLRFPPSISNGMAPMYRTEYMEIFWAKVGQPRSPELERRALNMFNKGWQVLDAIYYLSSSAESTTNSGGVVSHH